MPVVLRNLELDEIEMNVHSSEPPFLVGIVDDLSPNRQAERTKYVFNEAQRKEFAMFK
jgi:hypothetical protein